MKTLKVHAVALGIVAACVGFIYMWVTHPALIMGALVVFAAAYLYHSLTNNVREWLS